MHIQTKSGSQTNHMRIRSGLLAKRQIKITACERRMTKQAREAEQGSWQESISVTTVTTATSCHQHIVPTYWPYTHHHHTIVPYTIQAILPPSHPFIDLHSYWIISDRSRLGTLPIKITRATHSNTSLVHWPRQGCFVVIAINISILLSALFRTVGNLIHEMFDRSSRLLLYRIRRGSNNFQKKKW